MFLFGNILYSCNLMMIFHVVKFSWKIAVFFTRAHDTVGRCSMSQPHGCGFIILPFKKKERNAVFLCAADKVMKKRVHDPNSKLYIIFNSFLISILLLNLVEGFMKYHAYFYLFYIYRFWVPSLNPWQINSLLMYATCKNHLYKLKMPFLKGWKNFSILWLRLSYQNH